MKSIFIHKEKWLVVLGSITTLSIFAPVLADYFNIGFSLNNIWLLLLPFIVKIKYPGEFSYRYIYIVSAAISIYFYHPTPFLIYVACLASIYGFIEMNLGKLNNLAPLVLILIAPITKYFFDVFGFPIRLMLTHFASKTLSLLGYITKNEGSQIWINEDVFTVDTACMGMKLVITSLLICLLIISQFEKTRQRSISNLQLLGLISLTIVLIVASNFSRILLLIIFRSEPETFSHEFIGLICLICFTIVPLYFVTKKRSFKWNSNPPKKELITSQLKKSNILLIALIASSLLYRPDFKDIPFNKVFAELPIPNCETEILPNNIIKHTGQNTLIYIKPCKAIFRANHNPYICWEGSGFSMKNPKQFIFEGQEIYIADLISNNKKLKTAWWFQSSETLTNSQLLWRWKSISNNESFALINVSCENETELLNQIEMLFDISWK